MNNKPDSPVVELLKIVWDNACKKSSSWRLLNHALGTTLMTAISCGFVFEEDDFLEIEKRFRPEYWMEKSDSGRGELIYALAACGPSNGNLGVANISAAMAFEKWKGRKPYIVDSKRVALGSALHHPEYGLLWVTFIDSHEIRACWYDNPGNYAKGKPIKRYTFDHKTVKECSQTETP